MIEKKYVYGLITLFVTAIAITIFMVSGEVKLDVNKEDTKIYINESGEFVLGGIETISISNYVPYSVVLSKSSRYNYVKVTRTSKYNISSKIFTLKSVYEFNGSISDLELFPIKETHTVSGGTIATRKGLQLVYKIDIFSPRVKATLPDGTTISSSGVYYYNITKSPQTFSIRMFDPEFMAKTTDDVFTELKSNDAMSKTAEFKMVTSEVLAKESLKLTFNEVRGKVNSYKIYIQKNVTREVIENVIDKVDCKIIEVKINNTSYEECTNTYKEIKTLVTETQWVIVDSIPNGDFVYKIEADIESTTWEENGVMKTGYAIDWIPELKSSTDEIFKQSKWAWWNVSYSKKMLINQSLMTSGTLFYVNGSNGVNINGTKVYVLATSNTGNVSLYYNNATDYVVIENDTYVQTNFYSTGDKTYYNFEQIQNQTDIINYNSNLTNNGFTCNVTGKIGKSCYIATAGGKSNMSSVVSDYPIGSSDRTFKYWIRDVSTTIQPGYQFWGYGISAIRAEFEPISTTDGGGALYLTINGDDVTPITIPRQLGWYMLTFTYKDSTKNVSVYYNSTLWTSKILGASLATSSSNFKIGSSGIGYAGNTMDFYIDEFFVKNYTMTSTEIEQIFNNQKGTVIGYGDVYAYEEQSSNPITINSINITPINPRDNDILNVTINVTGAVNGTLNCSDESGIVYSKFIQPMNYNVSYIDSSLTIFGRNITCNITVFNGTYNKTSLSNRVYINNSLNPITINSVNITAKYSLYSDTLNFSSNQSNNLTCYASVNSSISINYSWYRNSINIFNGSLLSKLPSNYTTYDNITCLVTAINGTFNKTSNITITIQPYRVISLFNGLNNVSIELGSILNINATFNPNVSICLDILPDYGYNISCANETLNYMFNISNFKKTTDNNSRSSFNQSGNLTFLISSHRFDVPVDLRFNISGYPNGTIYPSNVNVKLNNISLYTYSSIFSSNQQTENEFYDGRNTAESRFDSQENKVVSYIKVPKSSNVTNATMSILAFNNLTLNITQLYCSVTDCNGNSSNLSFAPNSTLPFELCIVYASNNSPVKCYNYTSGTYGANSIISLTNYSIDASSSLKLRLNWNRIKYNDGNNINKYDSGITNNIKGNTSCLLNSVKGSESDLTYIQFYTGSGCAINQIGTGSPINFPRYYKNSAFCGGTPTYQDWRRNETSFNYRKTDGYILTVKLANITEYIKSDTCYNMDSSDSLFTYSGINLLISTCTNTTNFDIFGSNYPYILNSFTIWDESDQNTINLSTCSDGFIIYEINLFNYAQSSGYVYSSAFTFNQSSNYARAEFTNQVQSNMTIKYAYNNFTSSNIEIGVLDGIKERYFNSSMNSSIKLNDFSSHINSYLSSCTQDNSGNCDVPIYIYSSNASSYYLFGLEVNFTVTINPVIINTTYITNYLSTCTGYCNIPINITSSTNGIIKISDIQYTYYGGNKSYNITVHNSEPSYTSSVISTFFYSGWNYSLPRYVNYIEFIPSKPTSKNVTPYGQTSTKPIFNITNLAYANNYNFSMYQNETDSCVNITVSTSNNKSAGTIIGYTGWSELYSNSSYLTTKGLWMWADYSCNTSSSWRLWSPDWNFRACCLNCICDTVVN